MSAIVKRFFRTYKFIILTTCSLLLISYHFYKDSNKGFPDLASQINYLTNGDTTKSNTDTEKTNSQTSSSKSSNQHIEPFFDFTEEEILKLNEVSPEQFLSGNESAQAFFDKFFNIVLENEMSYPLERRKKNVDGSGKPHIDNVFFKKDPNEIHSENGLRGMFDFPDDFIQDMTKKHENIVQSLPDYIPNFYQGNGYAIVGGGRYSWYSLLAVKCLRNAGALLPVEIILPTAEDYDHLLCETMLPLLNARCINVEEIFGKERLDKLKISGYQLKALALLASSFKNVFLMDSDSYVVTNPEHLFTSEIYQKNNMLSWPDFWRRTTSPVYYQIAGIDVPETPVRHLNDIFTDVDKMHLTDKEDYNYKDDLNFHDRKNTLLDWSSESGQLLINKDTHLKALLLAFYYNRDGPFGYHPLLSQGGAGEGDKETFVAAAHRLGLNYYQVYKKSDGCFGFWNLLNSWEHGAIIQYDPETDWKNVQKVSQRIKADIQNQGDDFKYDYSKYFIDGISVEDSIPLFYHCHDPKFDPFVISERNIMFVDEFTDEEKKHRQKIDRRRRVYGQDFPRGTVDLELNLWEMTYNYLCEQHLYFSNFGNRDVEKLCKEFMPDQLDFLRKSHDYIMAHYDPSKGKENLEGSNDIFGEDEKKGGSTDNKENEEKK